LPATSMLRLNVGKSNEQDKGAFFGCLP